MTRARRRAGQERENLPQRDDRHPAAQNIDSGDGHRWAHSSERQRERHLRLGDASNEAYHAKSMPAAGRHRSSRWMMQPLQAMLKKPKPAPLRMLPIGGPIVKPPSTRLAGAILVLVLAPLRAQAEHAKITLEVAAPGGQQTAYMDQTPPEWGKNPRPVVKARTGDPIKIQVMFINVYPHKTLENAVIHFFVVRQEKPGQKEIPALKDDVLLETAFDMDLKPGGKAGQRSTLRIDVPGVYLVRVESKNTQSDHEHFAAIDLVVEAR
jgi:hypothetical protein